MSAGKFEDVGWLRSFEEKGLDFKGLRHLGSGSFGFGELTVER